MVWPPVLNQDVEDKIDEITFPAYFRPGYYSLGAFTSASPSSTGLTVTTAYLRPFLVLATQRFDRIGVNVSSGGVSGSLIQAAIFQPGQGVPGARLLETATAASDTSGAKTWTIDQTLTPGVWWLGVRPVVSGCSVSAINTTSSGNPFVQNDTNPPTNTNAYSAYTYTVAAGTAGFPASGATPAGTTAIFPFVALRAAA
jgi:hypothetical protein